MSEEPAILFANEAFYLAFTNRDLATMETLWSRSAPVSCIHPGWRPLVGREAVMESWRNIFGNPQSPAIACRDPRVLGHGELAQVLCYEVLAAGTLAAVNLFRKESGTWTLVHHQASPVADPPRFEDPEPDATRRLQ